MVFLNRQRARVLVGALIAALVVPIAIAFADFYGGNNTRNNGTPFSGYYITQSADDWDCDFALRKGAGNWRNISLRVTPYIRELPWVEGVDKYYGGAYLKKNGVPDKNVYGKTRYYGTQRDANGWLEELAKYYPDVYIPATNRFEHTATCLHTRNWQMCTVAIYRGAIEEYVTLENFDAGSTVTTVDQELENTATHEIGHTLRLAHPPQTSTSNDGFGTQDGANHAVPNGQRSIMRDSKELPPLPTPTQYDKTELRIRWGS